MSLWTLSHSLLSEEEARGLALPLLALLAPVWGILNFVTESFISYNPILHITGFGHLDSMRYETKIIIRLTLCLSLVSSFLSAKNKTQLNSLFEEDGLKIIQYEGET